MKCHPSILSLTSVEHHLLSYPRATSVSDVNPTFDAAWARPFFSCGDALASRKNMVFQGRLALHVDFISLPLGSVPPFLMSHQIAVGVLERKSTGYRE